MTQRPAAITPVTIAMCVTNFLGFFLTNWTPRPHHHPLSLFLLNTIMIFIGYLVLWYFRQARNWARWLVQLASLLALWNFWGLRKPIPPLYQTAVRVPMVVAEALIAVFLLYYLNTPRVRAWFVRAPADQSHLTAPQQAE